MLRQNDVEKTEHDTAAIFQSSNAEAFPQRVVAKASPRKNPAVWISIASN